MAQLMEMCLCAFPKRTTALEMMAIGEARKRLYLFCRHNEMVARPSSTVPLDGLRPNQQEVGTSKGVDDWEKALMIDFSEREFADHLYIPLGSLLCVPRSTWDKYKRLDRATLLRKAVVDLT
ncbi:hypothetical protein Pint_35849 [Pistacia integerrima]|uniref:Uncharacterized protein n=1 Tax=Pistacia integerrima TaxID=434235 RepID=A0ACC0Y0B3_9ROSI|nr:hypothetical protein Pint_35849 [Pistacia integerrima]